MSSVDNINFESVDQEQDLYSEMNNTTAGAARMQNTVIKQNVPFDNKIFEYVKQNNPKIYLLSPCFASLCYVNYVNSLMRTVELCRHYGIKLQIEFCRSDSLVSRARNNLVARAMSDPEMTHIMFVDNDITWDPLDMMKLMVSDKQLIGGIYPLKNYNWADLVKDKQNPFNSNVIQSMIARKNQSQFKNVISDEDMVQYNLLKYNVNYISPALNIEENLSKVKHIATGFMMIQRNVIEKMSKAFPSTKYVDDINFLKPHENEFAYALFDCGVEEGHYFSEDWLFCHRWTKMGGSVWMDVSITLTHTGIEDFRGCYLASLI
jgi:hypothetical protein